MATETQSVKIPIDLLLDGVKNQLQSLQGMLDNVKPDTKAYKELNRIIQGINKQYGKLAIEGKRSFSSAAQFTSFRKGLNDLEIRVDTFQDSFKKINISDLNIDTTKLDELKSKISEIQKSRGELINKTLKEVFDDAGLKKITDSIEADFNSISFEELGESFKKIINNARDELSQLKDEYTKIEKVISDKKSINLEQEISSRYDSKAIVNISKQKDAIKNLKEQNEIFKNFDFKTTKNSNVDDFINNMSAQVEAALANYQKTIETRRASLEKEKEKLKNALNIFGESSRWAIGDKGAAQKEKVAQVMGKDFISQYKTVPKIKEAIEATLKNLDIDEKPLIEKAKSIAETWISSLVKSFSIDGSQADQIANSLKNFLKNTNFSFDMSQLIPREGEAKDEFISRLVGHLKEKNSDIESAYETIQDLIENKQAEINSLLQAQTNLFSDTGASSAKLLELDTQEQKVREEINKVTQAIHKQAAAMIGGIASTDSFESAIGQLDVQVAKAEQSFRNLQQTTAKLEEFKRFFTMWFSFSSVINTVKNQVHKAAQEIKALDDVITEIAMVTDMTQNQLWDQISSYSDMARQYGVSTRGAYEVSQLFYQQGLQTVEVLKMTEETLKLAKIAGLDYATATDYMTVAIRGFKLEMSEASHVTDVYAALAAATASDVEELAVAMSKTASSAEAVGASFESTSAMIATMVSVTREAPQNIGSAIVSRYGEMTSDPSKIVDSEGEEMSLNRVDKALQSVGITLHDVNGQFRDFDDVILELSKKWDTLDANSQRYLKVA